MYTQNKSIIAKEELEKIQKLETDLKQYFTESEKLEK